ncbi:glutamate--tRNA ligase [Benzoatithermus flavus]|uniref:Glutamate--tRNA ligase n=1 Tax=Benzoatithermus flavus TaxID=3108223 RepID=A0ABU8XKA1_9PROT
MPPVVRFAPSPTGYLHLGNARIAVVNWLFAQKEGGRLILRIDDTDVERSEARFEAAIREDLTWLGLSWQQEVRQSDRTALYEAAFARLVAEGRVYPCYETQEELAALRERQRAAGQPPRYDRRALALSPTDRARLEAEGRRPHWRLLLPEGEIGFGDLLLGPRRFPTASLSDPVLRRADGSATYLFASAVDDADLSVSHVIRGEDHVTNTVLQLAIWAALGEEPPAFAHLPLISDAAGRSFSKRLGALSLRALREQGIEPMAIVLTLAALGTAEAADPALGMSDLVARFSLEAYGRAAPKLVVDDLPRFSKAVLHHLPFAAVASRLAALGLDRADEAFWCAVRGNLDRLEDARDWWEVCTRPLRPVIADPELLAAAAELLPQDVGDEAAFTAWIDALKVRTGRKGKALFRPLRLALTAREHGPELKHLLPLLGRDRAWHRLRGETA